MQRTRIIRGLATAAAIGALGLAAAAVPASAVTTNDVLITGSTLDTHFGNAFTGGVATDAGELNWNESGNNTRPELTGNLYIQQSTNVQAEVEMDIWDNSAHDTLIATKRRTLNGSGGLSVLAVNALGNTTCDCRHVHIRLKDDRSGTLSYVFGTERAFTLL